MDANLNFLLPLCDWMFGTLRTRLSPEEMDHWPTFDQTKRQTRRRESMG